MRIVVDINHPANVHYFKHFIKEMESRGHEIMVTASNKEVSYRLLDAYNIPYKKLGSYGKSLIYKMISIPLLDWRMLSITHRFKPDLFLGHGSIRAAHASTILGVPCIATDDTEHATLEHMLYLPFTDHVLTPDCFHKKMMDKQILFPSFMELLYLHPQRFSPDVNVLKDVNIEEGERFIIVRFVSWEASHDIGQSGVADRVSLVRALQKEARVLISSESTLPEDLENLRLNISPEKLHDLLYYATLYVGEGSTTASECAMLGTPAIYVNTLTAGTLEKQEKKYGLIHRLLDEDKIVKKSLEIVRNPSVKQEYRALRDKMLTEKTDVTEFLVKYIENLQTDV